MPRHFLAQRLARQTAGLSILLRNLLTNAAAGLIAAVLLGYWTPATRRAEPLFERPLAEAPATLNADPISGKLLDRIEGAAAPSVATPSLRPILTHYGLYGIAGASDAPAVSPPVSRKSLSAKATRISAPKPADEKTVEAAKPDQPAPAGAAPTVEESESWMSRLSPTKLTARVAPMGRDIAGGVAARAASVGRAVTDSLGALGL